MESQSTCVTKTSGLPPGGHDLTVIPETSGKSVVEAVLQKLLQLPSFLPDYLFLRRIAYVESRYGEEDFTYRNGYDGGIWQVDETTFQLGLDGIASKSTVNPRAVGIATQSGVDISTIKWRDLRKPFYSGLFCAIYLYVKLGIDEPVSIPSQLTEQASIWQKEYRPTLSTTIFLRGASERGKTIKCKKSRPIDTTFLIDTSASLGIRNFRLALKFVAQLASDFQQLSTNFRTALMTYSTETRTEIPYTFYNNDSDAITITSRILNTKYLRGNTYTGKAIRKAIAMMHHDRGDSSRQHSLAVQSLVLVTDGKSSDNVKHINDIALEHGINIFAIGVGGEIDLDTLLTIVDGDNSRVFQAQDYSNLASSMRDVMIERACSTPTLLNIRQQHDTFSEKLPSAADQPLETTDESRYQLRTTANSAVLITFKIQNDSDYSTACSQRPLSDVTVFASPDNQFVNSAFYTSIHKVNIGCANADTPKCQPENGNCKQSNSVRLWWPQKRSAGYDGSLHANITCNSTGNNHSCSAGGLDLTTTSFSVLSSSREALLMVVSTDNISIESQATSSARLTSKMLTSTAKERDDISISTLSYESQQTAYVPTENDGTSSTFGNIIRRSYEFQKTEITTTSTDAFQSTDHVGDEQTIEVIVICGIAGFASLAMALYLVIRRYKNKKKRRAKVEDETTETTTV